MFSVALLWTTFAAGAPPTVKLEVVKVMHLEQLTDSFVWTASQRETNPPQATWVLERRLSLEQMDDATSWTLRAELTGATRALDKKTCDPKKLESALSKASEAWEKEARARLPELARMLEAPESKSDMREFRFERWKMQLNQAWNKSAAFNLKPCVPQARAQWLNQMKVRRKGEPSLIARLPARRWSGGLSVRASLKALDKTLVGQFLVDTQAWRSLSHPSWLEGQGAGITFLLANYGKPERVAWAGGDVLAKAIPVQEISVSGLVLPIPILYVTETDRYGAPENQGDCCDGAIGLDILRHYAVEFDPGFKTRERAHVRLWSRIGFDPGEAWVPIAAEIENGKLTSPCNVKVSWSSGGLEYIESASGAQRSGPGSLICSGHTIATGVPGGALRIGASFLGGMNWMLDVGNGKIWFRKDELSRARPLNQTGLVATYIERGSDRILKVQKATRPEHAQMGLVAGVEIQRVNGFAADDLDLWDWGALLSGRGGPVVDITWQKAEILTKTGRPVPQPISAGKIHVRSAD